MDDKNTVEVVIDGEIVTLSGTESAEYIQKLALYIDRKISELSGGKKFFGVNSFTKTLLIAANIADDMFKEKENAENVRKTLALRETEIERLKTENARLAEEADKALILASENLRLKQRVKSLQEDLEQDEKTQAVSHIKLKRL
ncbi:MAG: cell division protein ZapA [Clostridiales bacterium]|jgi:cell division protein ZapA|nr:cell division protein ZapA [Clostridiales bacterium]